MASAYVDAQSNWYALSLFGIVYWTKATHRVRGLDFDLAIASGIIGIILLLQYSCPLTPLLNV